MTTALQPELLDPGRGGGLNEVLRRRFLLRLLVRRELRARYKGSFLGLGWSYVRPAVNFAVYFFVVGVFLGMDRHIAHFPIYLFAGMVLINLFTDTLHSATRSVTGNAALVRKVYLPREMFPTASLLVSLVHFVPGFAILLGAALSQGWRPSAGGLGAALLGFAIVVTLAMALGLFSAAINVLLRDLEQAVDVLMIVITWSVPMIYPWTFVRDQAPGWVLDLYLANPLVAAVSLFQRAFWYPTAGSGFTFPPDLYPRAGLALVLAVTLLVLAQFTFARLQRRFAQEL
jgi:ABC-type polysaccharide/polyol phosphate export permease